MTKNGISFAPCELTGLAVVWVQPDNIFLKSSQSDLRGFTTRLGDFGLSRWVHFRCPVNAFVRVHKSRVGIEL